MAIPEPEAPQERKKKTLWLLAAGAASLLIPLAGAVYLHWSENAGSSGPTGRSDVFERREGDDRKIIPTQAAIVTSPSALTAPPPSGLIAGAADKPAASSLDFIKTNPELQAKIADSKKAAVPAASTAAAAPAPAPPPPAAAARTSKKRGPKPFTMPKLQLSRGFTNFSSPGANGAQNGAQGSSGQNTQDMLKNLPPGAENDPRVQAYLKSHQSQ